MSNSSMQESTKGPDRPDVDGLDPEEFEDSLKRVQRSVPRFEYREWLLLAPAVVALAYLPLVVAFGQELLYTTHNGEPHLLGFGLMAVLVAVATIATGHLFDDAAHVAGTTDWSPNPWLYTMVGTAVVTAALVGRVLVLEGMPGRPVEFVGGTVVVALLLSSVVACPVYVYRRRRLVET